MKNTLTKLALAGTLALGLTGCGKEEKNAYIIPKVLDSTCAEGKIAKNGSAYFFMHETIMSPARDSVASQRRLVYNGVSAEHLRKIGLNPNEQSAVTIKEMIDCFYKE